MYLIRVFCILLLTFSCSTNINYGYFEMYANAIFKNRINVDDEFINSVNYSFIKARYNRNEATLILAKNQNGIMEWVGADMVHIKTKNGIIIETTGLPSNISYYRNDVNKLLNPISRSSDFHFHLYIDEPELIHTKVNFLFKASEPQEIIHGGSNKKVQKVIYEKKSDSIGWRTLDNYYIDKGRVIKTEQSLSPLAGKIEIEFYYK